MIRSTPDEAVGNERINFSWLLKLRWGALVGQLGAILIVHYSMPIRLVLVPLFVTLALEAVVKSRRGQGTEVTVVLPLPS